MELEKEDYTKELSKRDKVLLKVLYGFEKSIKKITSVKQSIRVSKYSMLLLKFRLLSEEMKTFERFQKMIDGDPDYLSQLSEDYLTKINILFEESIKLQNAFNNENDPKIREVILKSLFGKVGDGAKVWPSIRCDLGINIEVGKNSFINKGCILQDTARIIIGKGVKIGPGTILSTTNHGVEPSLRDELYDSKPIVIKDNVWLGAGVKVVPGVTIGEWSVIGSGSVVTKDIPPFSVAAGSPCRVIRSNKEA